MSKRVIAAACLGLLPASAMAVDLDFTGGDQSDFRGVGEDLAAAFAYRSASPAETKGLLGFDVGGMISYTTVENGDDWQDLVGEDPSGLGFVNLVARELALALVAVAVAAPAPEDVGLVMMAVAVPASMLGLKLAVPTSWLESNDCWSWAACTAGS